MSQLLFKDHFSTQSEAYASHRPGYPDALFEWLAARAPATDSCWDCATGSGQAAISLSKYFNRVIATDASAEQIRNAIGADTIDYHVAAAENSGLDPASVELIVVAQALHWLNLPAFFKEVDRVLKPQGLLAILSYNLLGVDTEVNEIIHDFYHYTLDGYWPAERLLVEQGYADIQLPYTLLETPIFTMEARWNLHQLLGYLNTWSAVRCYVADAGDTPLIRIAEDLQAAWGDPLETKSIQWPLTLRVAVKPPDKSRPVCSGTP